MYDSVRVLACQKISMTKGDFIQGTICTLVTLVGRKPIQLRHLNFDPYPSHTLAMTVGYFGSYLRNIAHVLILKRCK